MSSTTNTAINSRSINGVITISDGEATLENGNLNCYDIISSSLKTSNINTSLLTCSGKFECNLSGPYTIPISISNLTGLLISYGNVTNSGATDFTNFQSTYTSTQGGFRFFNKSATQTLTNLAIIDNSQTYFSSQLTGCLAESPVNANSVVNKTYVDSNFLDRTNNLTQNINGLKTFTSDTAFNAQTTFNSLTPICSVASPSANNHLTRKDYVDSNFLDRTNNLTQNVNGEKTFTNNLISNSQTTFNNLTPICSVASPTAVNHLTRKDYVDNNFLDRTNNLTQNVNGEKTFTNNLISNSQTTFNNLTPICSVASPTAVNHLTRKDYVDNNFLDRTNNLTQNVNGLKTFTNNCDFSSIISLKNKKLLNETQNIQTDTNYTLNFPFPETTVIRTITLPVNTITIILPAVSATERGLLFNFFKFKNGLSVIFQSTSLIFTLNNLSVGSTTNTTLLSSDKIMTTLMCGSFGTTYYWVEVNTYSTFDRDQNNLLYARLASPNAFTNTNTFNSFLPTSTLTPSSDTQLITKKFADQTYIDLTTDQTITASNKRFAGLFTTALNITPVVGGATGNRQQLYMSGDYLVFMPQFNNNIYAFQCKDSVPNLTTPLTIDSTNTTIANNLICSSGLKTDSISVKNNNINFKICTDPANTNTSIRLGNASNSLTIETPRITLKPSSNTFSTDIEQSGTNFFIKNNNLNGTLDFRVSTNAVVLLLDANNTTISNNLISNGQATFNNSTPICSVSSPTANNHLTRKDYVDNNFVDKTNTQTGIAGDKTFTGRLTNTFVIFAKDLSWLDAQGSGGRVQAYLSATDLGFISVNVNNNRYFFNTKDGAGNPTNPLIISSASTTISNNLVSNSQATFNAGAVFNTVLPTTTITASSANELVNYTTLTSQGFITSSSILSANNSFTGFNTFTNGLTIKSTLLLKDFTNSQQGTIDLGSAILSISCDVNSGKVQINTHDSGGNSYNRVIINEYEFNLTVPITLFLDYTYYNPFNFTSTRLGYSMSNTGSTNTLTNNVANNSGQINIPAGSWNITYTGTITVITNAITTLTSLEIYVADNLTNDLNIIGINVINYYKISTVPVGQKMRISGSGNYISYTNVNTELNLRLLPLFTAGTGGLNFQGKISATRNA